MNVVMKTVCGILLLLFGLKFVVGAPASDVVTVESFNNQLSRDSYKFS